MYRNYIFDLYGTLVDIHTDEEALQLWEKLSFFYGYYGARYTPAELKKAYEGLVKGSEGPVYSHEAYPEIRIETVFRALFEKRGVQPDEALVLHAGQFFRALATEYIRLYEGAVEMLEMLREKGRNIYLLSNAQRIFTGYELHMLDIAKYFDGIIISSDWEMKKPDRRLFEQLLKTYGLDPRESIMIGNDSETDIAGAACVGMDTCYIHSNLSPECKGSVDATYVQMEMNLERLCAMLGIGG